jgi:hypothetical protein
MLTLLRNFGALIQHVSRNTVQIDLHTLMNVSECVVFTIHPDSRTRRSIGHPRAYLPVEILFGGRCTVPTARKPFLQTGLRLHRTGLAARFARPEVMEHYATKQDRMTVPFGTDDSSYVFSASTDSSETKWITSLLLNARRILIVLLILQGLKAKADVTLLIEAPINFLGHVSSTGHTALLTDHLCSDDHIRMRWCHAGEDGAVVSRYKGINGYDWLAMPPGPYLFAVDSSGEVPETTSLAEVTRLRAEYRANHAGSFESNPPDDGWIQLLGASYRRRIVCVHVRTTEAQDEDLMLWLNRRPNRTHFNFFFSNCADFVRQMLDVLFPSAVHRNIIFDLGMTTPKQLESSLHHYALRHPELEFRVCELPQVPGDIPRSGHLYGVTESLVKSKPYLFAAAVLDPIGIGSVGVLGIADHRYSAKAPARVDDGFFFHTQNAVAMGR